MLLVFLGLCLGLIYSPRVADEKEREGSRMVSRVGGFRCEGSRREELERAAGTSTGTEATAPTASTETASTEASAAKGAGGEAASVAGVAAGEDGSDDHAAEDRAEG